MFQRDLAIVYDVAYPFVEGGGQKRMYEVGRRLARRGWKVTWYTLKSWSGPKTLVIDGISYCGLDGDSNLYTKAGRRSVREAISFGWAVWRVRGKIARHSRIWCGQWPYFHIIALLASCRHRMVVDWWETWGHHWLDYGGRLLGYCGYFLERSAAMVFSRAGELVTIAVSARADVIAAGARQNSVKVIPNGINCAEIENVQPTPAGSDVIYAGRLKSHKNVDHLITAVALLRDLHGVRVTADIIGDGPERSRLESRTGSLNLQDQVRFHGELSTPEMLARVKGAGIFVHPSTKEGGGSITLLEANACGVPVVIYRHRNGIDPSLITPGVTGAIVEEVGPEALAKALVESICRENSFIFNRPACIKFARQYDWDSIASSYDELLSKVHRESMHR